MRLLVTTIEADECADVVVDAEGDASVGDLACALIGPVHAAERHELHCDGVPLDPDESLATSPVRHGSVLGLGPRAATRAVEPGGLVEVRTAGGPGAGRVVRLWAGSYTLGSGPCADVRLDDPDLPALCGRVVVRADGHTELDLDPTLLGRTRPAPTRSRPLDGPIVRSTGHPERDPDGGRSAEEATAARARSGSRRLRPGTTAPVETVTTDPQDDVPLVHLDRRPLGGRCEWPAGASLAVGRVLLDLGPVRAPDASLSAASAGAALDFNRPPRLLPTARRTTFGLPPRPSRPDHAAFPLIMVAAPVLVGTVLYLVTRSTYSLLFVAMSPLMALGSWLSGARQGRRRAARDQREHDRRTTKIRRAALAAQGEERTARRRDFADPAEVLLTATGPRARLWERRRGDPDFLVVRVGTADQPSEVTVEDPSRESHEGVVTWTAPDVPVTVSLADAGVTGITGPQRRSVARWVLAQSAVHHAPADLEVVLLVGPDAGPDPESDWGWLRWIPHARGDADGPLLARVGTDDLSTASRVAELAALLEQRWSALENVTSTPPAQQGHDPVLVVLDGARGLRLLDKVPDLLRRGPRVGILFLCLDTDERLLPEECRAVVDAERDDSSVRLSGAPVVEGVRADLVDDRWAEVVARALAPLRDAAAVPAGAALPGASRLLDVVGHDAATTAGVLERWTRCGRSTEAVVGVGEDGPLRIDVVRDGPHGLVAGTTGSGKSELLQTLVASLALGNRPDELSFVLVDYKGGAAFKDCSDLPHTVGTVTDLDAHLTSRALDSLAAELRRREHQLAAVGAKDIEDHQAGRAPGDRPMPRLVIVIDEFAALAAELPDFVTGLVDIARRGRSLGVHLVLATQRPAGVVTAEIRSNTNLRIALRVTDGADSSDVLGTTAAASISPTTPGRAWARLGHSSPVAFQTARVGGRHRPAGSTPEVALRAMTWESLGLGAGARTSYDEDVATPTDLAALVEATRAAATGLGVRVPASPWLPPLPESVVLEDLVEQFPASRPTPERVVLPFGLYDAPSEQRRGLAVLDLAAGRHLAVVSAPRAGRSTVLRALAGAIGRWTSPEDVHVYGVDCGGNALLPLVGLPHTGAVVGRDQAERMTRLVERLRTLVSERQHELAAGGFADVAEQRAAAVASERMAYVAVLIDRWEGLVQAYDGVDGGAVVTAWQQVVQEGGAVGVTVVVTGDRSLAVGRMAALVEDRLMLRMTDPADFATIGMSPRQVPTRMTEGRGFRADGLRETQVALLDPDSAGTAQVGALQAVARVAAERYADLPAGRRPFRVDVLPSRIGLHEARALLRPTLPSSGLVLAVGGDTLALRVLDALEHGPALLVTGPRRSGRSTALRTMATFARERGWQVVTFTPRVSPLRDLVGAHGPFDATSDETRVREALRRLRDGPAPLLTLVDDIELVGADGWLPALLEEHLATLRDTGSVLVGAGSPDELAAVYRGPAVTLRRSGSGLMLSPQSSADADLFGARLPRSALGRPLPPGGGYLVSAGRTERVQVVWPQ